MKYDWPGNIRELEHLISRAALKALTTQGRQSRVVTISLVNLDTTMVNMPQENSFPGIDLVSVKENMS